MHFTNSLLLCGILCLSALAAHAQACPEDSLPEYLLPQVDIEAAIEPIRYTTIDTIITTPGKRFSARSQCGIRNTQSTDHLTRRKYDTQEERLFMTNSNVWMADPSARNGRN